MMRKIVLILAIATVYSVSVIANESIKEEQFVSYSNKIEKIETDFGLQSPSYEEAIKRSEETGQDVALSHLLNRLDQIEYALGTESPSYKEIISTWGDHMASPQIVWIEKRMRNIASIK